MNAAEIILVFCLSGCFGVTKSPDEAYDSLFEVTGYPDIGDIPILNRKVFKGVRVAIREHPYVVSIRRQFAHYLTGALLTRTLVLTVAHPLHRTMLSVSAVSSACSLLVNSVPIHELAVVLGENYADRGATLLTVILLVFHQDFDPYTLQNDIAILTIYENANVRSSVKIIKLLPEMSLNGTEAFVTGWGRCDTTARDLCFPRASIYYPDEKLDPMLKTTVFRITLPNFYCEGYKRQDVVLHPGMLCAGVSREENSVTPCLGIPGAPLVVQGSLAGLLSWGFGCGYSHDLPLVYTSTQYYGSWISHNQKVLTKLLKHNYTDLFEATRAYISCEWLRETRLTKTCFNDQDFDTEVQETSLDKELSHLRGYYYDIRDFIDNGRYYRKKLKIVVDNWRKEEKLDMLNQTFIKKPKGIPFIAQSLLEDSAEDNLDNEDETDDEA